MTVTKFIIALCPATPVYYAIVTEQDLKDCPEAKDCDYATTSDKSQALAFDTFDAAMDVASRIGGWGGAQRVEQVAVEVEDTRVTLDTPEARIEVRDAATFAFAEAEGDAYCRACAVELAMRELGLRCRTNGDPASAASVSVYLADHLGNLLTLDWDPMQDGFSYETEGDDACDIGETEAQHEAEPNTVCDGCGKPLSRKAARALRKWGKEKCQRAWHLNRLRGEGLTVCSIETGIPLRSLDSAINAWQEVWEQMFDRDCERAATKAETATCDGCGKPDAEPCGDSEGFAFCAACRAKDNDRSFHPHGVDADAEVEDLPLYADTASPSVFVSPEEIAAAVRRTDCATVTLTDEQRERAAVLLAAALRDLIDFHLPRLIGNAQMDAEEGW